MRRSQGFWVLIALCFLSFSSILAHANSLPPGDPVMQVDDPTCTPVTGGPAQNVFSQQIFSFSADASGGGCLAFKVAGSVPFGTIDIQFGQGNAVPFGTMSCTSNAFTCAPSNLDGTCNTDSDVCTPGTVTDLFFTANSCIQIQIAAPAACQSGFAAGTPFTVFLQGYNPGTTFYADANIPMPADHPNLIQQFNAPEPSSIVLLSAGAGALALRRKIFKPRD